MNKVNPKMLTTIAKHVSIWSHNYKPKQSTENMYKKEMANYEYRSSVKESCTLEKKSVNLKKKECPGNIYIISNIYIYTHTNIRIIVSN